MTNPTPTPAPDLIAEEYLCYYDPRNPNHVPNTEGLTSAAPDCACDNCFTGKTELAAALLAAALTAQAAALKEAKSVKWFGHYQRASRALLALGCRMGPDGRWEKPCPARDGSFVHPKNCENGKVYNPASGGYTKCRHCDGTGWLPISAPAKGEGET